METIYQHITYGTSAIFLEMMARGEALLIALITRIIGHVSQNTIQYNKSIQVCISPDDALIVRNIYYRDSLIVYSVKPIQVSPLQVFPSYRKKKLKIMVTV